MLRSLILGYPYLTTKRLIKKTEYWSADDLKAIQRNNLSRILHYAMKNIPFYKESLKKVDIDNTNDPFELLKKFPIVDKTQIRKNLNSFIRSTGIRTLRGNSGGSTGQPVVFYLDRFVTRQKEKSFIHDLWGRVGYKFGDRIFNIRGRTPTKNRFLHHDRLFNIYYASSLNINKNNIDDYIYQIKKIQPHFLHGYPSTIYQLAKFIKSSKSNLNLKFKAILCGSEKLFDFQRQTIESVFDCRVFSWYGQSECVTLAGECEHSHAYHVYPQYGYTEFLPTGLKNEQGKEIYDIVATGFINPVMPFIRYRCGDYAILSDVQNCQCGRNYFLIDEIIGREQEFVVDANEDLISTTTLIFGQHFEIFKGIESMQIHQDKPGEIEIIIVKGENYHDELTNLMKEKIYTLLGDRMKLWVSFSNNISRTSIGKAKLVDQKLDIKEYLR